MSKTLPITKHRKYDAFQAIYEVHAREGQDHRKDPAEPDELSAL